MKHKVTCEPLSRASFQPYGSVICPDDEVGLLNDQYRNANQGTAVKLINVCNIVRDEVHGGSTPNLNLFRCFSNPELQKCSLQDTSSSLNHAIKILEKHPFSSQTFLPLGGATQEYAYLIVVALPSQNGHGKDLGPDLSTLKAFICKGNQAVTYGKGIWHAPMIVVGKRDYIDFAVLIYETLDPTKPELDCIERNYNTEETEIVVSLFNFTM
ncbi:Ureidoglycolate lyase [Monosporozyma unispora]|nr:Ureidoglycolate lyase [Kazachstania unispora]